MSEASIKAKLAKMSNAQLAEILGGLGNGRSVFSARGTSKDGRVRTVFDELLSRQFRARRRGQDALDAVDGVVSASRASHRERLARHEGYEAEAARDFASAPGFPTLGAWERSRRPVMPKAGGEASRQEGLKGLIDGARRPGSAGQRDRDILAELEAKGTIRREGGSWVFADVAATPAKATPRGAAAMHPELGEPLRRRRPMAGDIAVDESTGARGVATRQGVIQWDGGKIERFPNRVPDGVTLYAGPAIPATPQAASSTALADMPPTQLAARYGLPLDDAKLFADWLDEHPGGSVAQWKASRRAPEPEQSADKAGRLRNFPRLSEAALDAGRQAAAPFRRSTSEPYIESFLVGMNSADLLRVADALNLSLPQAARTATARRLYIAQALAQHNRRTTGGF